jgi:hypothetical protein
MRSNTAYLALFFVAAVIMVAAHAVVSSLLGYASYWWGNHLWGADSNPGYSALFVLLPLLAALAVTLITRRWDWFLAVAAGAIVVHLLFKIVDDLTGLAISQGLVPSPFYWVLPTIVYGLAAALGAILGFMVMAGRRTARRTRL